MKNCYIGRSGLKVSKLCLGTMNFGQVTEDKEAFYMMDAALDAGINYFDTANMYSGGRPGEPGKRGGTEEVIGRWFAQGGGRRERVVLGTKVYGTMEDPLDGPNMDRGLSAYKIYRHLEGSLCRLQTDHIELYQMHHIDRNVAFEELFEAFQVLINQGKINYIGSSNFAGWHLVKAQNIAKSRNMMGIISEQHQYSLLCRQPELELLPAARDLGIGVTAWSPLNQGLLGGKVLNPGNRVFSNNRIKLIEKHRTQLEAFSKLCKELGEDDANVALAWILHNPTITAPIIGPRTMDQLNQALHALEIKLDESTMSRLDEIFPGPGGEAPEAYSW